MPTKVCAALVVNGRAVIGQKAILNIGLKLTDNWNVDWVNVANGAWQWTFPGGGIDSEDAGRARYDFWHNADLTAEEASQCVNGAAREFAEEIWVELNPECFEAIAWAKANSEIAVVIFRVKSRYSAMAATLSAWLEKYIDHYNASTFDMRTDPNSLAMALTKLVQLHNDEHGIIFGLRASTQRSLELRQLSYVPTDQLGSYIGVAQTDCQQAIERAANSKLGGNLVGKLKTLSTKRDDEATRHAARYKAVLALFDDARTREFGHFVSNLSSMYT